MNAATAILASLFTAAQAHAQGVQAPPATEVAWAADCSSTAGWHFKDMNAKVEQADASTIKITQDGQDGQGDWGKAAYVVENIDLDKASTLEITVSQIENNAAWSVAVASKDWSEIFTVISRSNYKGTNNGDIKDYVKKSRKPDLWKSPATFNVVIVVEGKKKSVWVKAVKIGGR